MKEFKKTNLEKLINNVTELELYKVIAVVQLPTGASEVIINTEFLWEKLEYYREAYDDDMIHKHAKRQKGDFPVKILGILILGKEPK